MRFNIFAALAIFCGLVLTACGGKPEEQIVGTWKIDAEAMKAEMANDPRFNYLPYADAHPDATAGWAEGALPDLPVRFDPQTAPMLVERPELRAVIEQCFALDPRPARHRTRDTPGSYAVRLWDVDVRAAVDARGWCITAIEPV